MSDVKGFDITIGLDTSEVSKQLRSFKSSLKETQKELKNVAADLKLDPKNITALTQKSKLLRDAVKNVSSQLSIQQRELKEAEKLLRNGALEGGEAAFDALQKKVNATKEQLAYFNFELGRTQDRIQSVKNEKWQSIGDLGNALNSVSKKVTALVAALTALVGVGIKSLTTLSDAAATANMTAEEYQKLAYAASMLGVDSTQAIKGIQKTATVMASLSSGTGANYEKLLKKIGLSYKDIQDLSPEDAFKAISDALKGCEDSTTALYVAQQLFGTELANKILPLIMAGSDAITELEDSATVASNESVQDAKKISASIQRVKSAFLTLAGSIASYVEPIVEKATAWVETNVIPTLQKIVDNFFSLDESTQKMIVGIVAVLAAAGPLLITIGKIGKGISSIVSIFSKGKIGVILAVITAIIAAVIKLYKENEDFRNGINKLFSTLKEKLSPIISKIGQMLERLSPVIGKILEAIGEIVSIIVDVITPIAGTFLEVIGEIVSIVAELAENILPIFVPILKVIGAVLKVIGEVIKVIWKILEPIFNLLKKLFTKLEEWLQESGFLDWLQDVCGWFQQLGSWIENGIGKIVDFFSKVDEGTGKTGFQQWLDSIVDGFKGFASWCVQATADLLEFLGIVKKANGEEVSFEELSPESQEAILAMMKIVEEVVREMEEHKFDPFYWFKNGGFPIPSFGGGGASSIPPVASVPSTTNNSTTNNVYNVTINTTASEMSIKEIDAALGGAIK